MRQCRRIHQHSSRREIDMALGALIGITHCSQERAFGVLVAAVHHTGTGLSVVPSALIAVAGDDINTSPDPNVASYWQRTLQHPTRAM